MKKEISNSHLKIGIFWIIIMAILILSNGSIIKAETPDFSSSEQKKAKAVAPARTAADFDLLPTGERFAFREDQTTYTKVLHVAMNNPQASDDNPGTAERPLMTINAAAQLLQPGEKVIVHEGIHRECIQPARVGTSPEKMITNEVAKGEKVIVKGSEAWKSVFRPSTGFSIRMGPPVAAGEKPAAEETRVWMAEMPASFFQGYNQFTVRNTYRYISRWGRSGEPEWLARALLYRGAVYADGKPLKQVLDPAELAQNENAFDGNLYDSRNDNGSFLINYPESIVWQNLSGWKEFFGLDTHSTQTGITADFDPGTGILEISIEGDLPHCQRVWVQ